jgi:hypothetical protein
MVRVKERDRDCSKDNYKDYGPKKFKRTKSRKEEKKEKRYG